MRNSFLTSLLLTLSLMAQSGMAAEKEQAFGDEFEAEFSDTADEELFDPLSGYNRMMTGFNDTVYTSLLFPVARGYEHVVPSEGRQAVNRFFINLHFPVRFVNNLLQLKIVNSGEELARFAVNTTLGIGGFFDPASTWLGLTPHPEDFGQTLGHYGAGGGFHIVWPLLGPSNLRDSLGMLSDWYIDPANYVGGRGYYFGGRGYNTFENGNESFLAESFELLNKTSLNYPQYESLKKDAVDLYPFFRNIYEQSRNKAIEE